MFCALMLGVALFYAWCGGRSLHEGATIGCAVDADNEKMHLWAMRGECAALRGDVWVIVCRQSERLPVVWCKYTTIETACQAFFAKNRRLIGYSFGVCTLSCWCKKRVCGKKNGEMFGRDENLYYICTPIRKRVFANGSKWWM